MIDFKKLMDPVYSAKIRAEIDAEQALRQKEEQRIDDMVSFLYDLPEGKLNDAETRFVRSLRHVRATYGATSPKQMAWLERLHTEHCEPQDVTRPQSAPKRFNFIRPK